MTAFFLHRNRPRMLLVARLTSSAKTKAGRIPAPARPRRLFSTLTLNTPDRVMSLLISTLGRYLTWRFFKTIAAVFLAIVGTIYVFDFVELLRRANSVQGITSGYIAYLTLLRTPAVAEQILPFCVLFGTMAAFIDLTRKLELIVARSAGVSMVWQFLLLRPSAGSPCLSGFSRSSPSIRCLRS